MYLILLTLLALSVSHGALDSGKTKMELVKEEALNICSPFKWSVFLCVLALSLFVCVLFVAIINVKIQNNV